MNHCQVLHYSGGADEELIKNGDDACGPVSRTYIAAQSAHGIGWVSPAPYKNNTTPTVAVLRMPHHYTNNNY